MSTVEQPSMTRRYVAAAIAVIVTLGAVAVAYAIVVSSCLGETGDPAPFRPGSTQSEYCAAEGGWWRLVGPDIVGGAVLLVSLVLLLLRELSTAARVALVLAPAVAALAVPVVLLALPD